MSRLIGRLLTRPCQRYRGPRPRQPRAVTDRPLVRITLADHLALRSLAASSTHARPDSKRYSGLASSASRTGRTSWGWHRC